MFDRLRVLVLSFAALSVVFCQEGGETDSGDGGSDVDTDSDGDGDSDGDCGWEVMVDGQDDLFELSVHGVWGTSSSDVFAAGRNTILHYDGETWQKMNFPFDGGGENVDLEAVWGLSHDDVFVVGGIVFGSCVIGHFNGDSWSEMDCSCEGSLWGIWGSEWNDVYAVGNHSGQPYILHYNGSIWNSVNTGHEEEWSGYSFLDIWGSSGEDVFIVGNHDYYNGIVVHFDGESWSDMLTDPDWYAVSSIFGFGGDDVFIGIEGTDNHPSDCIAHYDGQIWSSFQLCEEIDDSSIEHVWDIWGISSNLLYIADNNEIWRYDGLNWSMVYDHESSIGNDQGARSIWGSSENDIFVAGKVIWHYGCD